MAVAWPIPRLEGGWPGGEKRDSHLIGARRGGENIPAYLFPIIYSPVERGGGEGSALEKLAAVASISA